MFNIPNTQVHAQISCHISFKVNKQSRGILIILFTVGYKLISTQYSIKQCVTLGTMGHLLQWVNILLNFDQCKSI